MIPISRNRRRVQAGWSIFISSSELCSAEPLSFSSERSASKLNKSTLEAAAVSCTALVCGKAHQAAEPEIIGTHSTSAVSLDRSARYYTQGREQLATRPFLNSGLHLR